MFLPLPSATSRPHRQSASSCQAVATTGSPRPPPAATTVSRSSDRSLITSDDVPLARLHQPPVSVISRIAKDIEQPAAQLLLARTRDGERPTTVVLPPLRGRGQPAARRQAQLTRASRHTESRGGPGLVLRPSRRRRIRDDLQNRCAPHAPSAHWGAATAPAPAAPSRHRGRHVASVPVAAARTRCRDGAGLSHLFRRLTANERPAGRWDNRRGECPQSPAGGGSSPRPAELRKFRPWLLSLPRTAAGETRRARRRLHAGGLPAPCEHTALGPSGRPRLGAVTAARLPAGSTGATPWSTGGVRSRRGRSPIIHDRVKARTPGSTRSNSDRRYGGDGGGGQPPPGHGGRDCLAQLCPVGVTASRCARIREKWHARRTVHLRFHPHR